MHHLGIVGRPAAAVTTQTIHVKVIISFIDSFFTDRVGGVGPPLVTFGTKRGSGWLGYKQKIISGMGTVTGDAFAFLNRFTPTLVFGIVD